MFVEPSTNKWHWNQHLSFLMKSIYVYEWICIFLLPLSHFFWSPRGLIFSFINPFVNFIKKNIKFSYHICKNIHKRMSKYKLFFCTQKVGHEKNYQFIWKSKQGWRQKWNRRSTKLSQLGNQLMRRCHPSHKFSLNNKQIWYSTVRGIIHQHCGGQHWISAGLVQQNCNTGLVLQFACGSVQAASRRNGSNWTVQCHQPTWICSRSQNSKQ